MSAPERTAANANATPRSRWTRRLLIASLALNLLVLGVVASAAWRFRHGGPHSAGAVAMMSGSTNLLGFTQSLPPERRRMIWRETTEHRQAMRPLRAEVRQHREAVQAALLAEPFDAARFADAQAKALEAEIRARTESQKLFLAIARLLTKEERAAFTRWQPPMDQSRQKGPGGWWSGKNRGGNGEPREQGPAREQAPSRDQPVTVPNVPIPR